jgi:hypothetical protein
MLQEHGPADDDDYRSFEASMAADYPYRQSATVRMFPQDGPAPERCRAASAKVHVAAHRRATSELPIE